MASLSLKHIYKVYDGGVKAVNDFNMEIDDKEFVVFVGPSGCGKSTTLRMIAGLEEITAGELMIGGEVVNDVEPKDRNIAMVFQNYALYPHMTVRQNMEFALKLKKLPQEEIDKQVEEAARILDITQYLDRKPRALSGGQRQRVSLGRAIVRSPKVFLLDEPLSNLDAKLRAQMRTEISKLHDRLATTFIYVTHDQVEAMTMGTRIVVMRAGCVQQIDTPKNLYDYPSNIFVAGFIGTPQMNFFDATMTKIGDKVAITFANNRKILVPAKYLLKAKSKYFDGETKVVMGIRPEDVLIDKAFVEANPETALETNINIIEALGSQSIIYCELDPENNDDITNTKTRLVISIDPRLHVGKGHPVKVAINPERIHLFDKETEETILPMIPLANEVSAIVSDGKLNVYGSQIKLPQALDLANGSYTLSIPSDAILFEGINSPEVEDFPVFEAPTNYEEKYAAKRLPVCNYPEFAKLPIVPMGQKFAAKVVSQEVIGKKILLQLEVGKDTIFAVAPSETKLTNVNVSIDLKRVTFVQNGEVVVNPLAERSVLSAHLVNERASKKEYNFFLNVEGTNFYSTELISDKLITAAGRKVFNVNLSVDFTPYGVLVSDEGLEVSAESILDYGTEKFAVCRVNDKTFNVLLEKDSTVEVGDQIKVVINPYTLGIVDADRDIRII